MASAYFENVCKGERKSISDWWKISPACQACNDYENCDEPCAMAMNFLQGSNDNDNGYDEF